MPSIYRITYPNGKIYVGKDLTDTVAYFGSVDSSLIQADLPPDQTDVFTVTKEILLRSDSAEEESERSRVHRQLAVERSGDRVQPMAASFNLSRLPLWNRRSRHIAI